MSKISEFTQSEIRSGILVFVSFCVLIALIFMSGSYTPFQKKRHLEIVWNYVNGLQKNAPVHVAGHPVGKVKEIRFLGNENPQVLVICSVSDDVILRKDAEAFLNVAGFMGEMFVELSPGSAGQAPLGENERITGFDPIPLMELVKKGAELTEEFEKITKSLSGIVVSLEGIVGENREEMDHIFDNLDSATANMNEMTADLKHHPWKLLRKGKEKSMDEILEEASEKRTSSEDSEN